MSRLCRFGIGALALGATGCVESTLVEGAFGPTYAVGLEDDPALTLTVLPMAAVDDDGNPTALPQTFGPAPQSDWVSAAADLALDAPLLLTGTITGAAVTPYAGLGGVPTVTGPVAGRVRVTGDWADYDVPLDPTSGAYAVVTLPGTYEIAVVPDSPLTAPAWWTADLSPDEAVWDRVLGEGVALWGQIRADDAPLADCEVFAIDDAGHETASVWTDANGRYTLRVPEGLWTVVAAGRRDAREPTLVAAPVAVTGAGGASVDLAYDSLERVAVSLRVERDDGQPVDDVPVRFTAVTLDGAPSGALVQEGRVTLGAIDLQIPPGRWTVEVLPEQASDLTPYRSAAPIEIHDNGPLATVTLAPFVTLTGTVTDAGGAPVAGGRVVCAEVDAGDRSWTNFAGDDGRFLLSLPQALVRCDALAPADRPELATTTFTVAPSAGLDWSVLLLAGDVIQGLVRQGDTPATYAVVEARDADGVLRGSALTDGDGAFALTVPRAGAVD